MARQRRTISAAARATTLTMGVAACAVMVAGCSFHASIGEPVSPTSSSTSATASAPPIVDKDRLANLAKQKLEEAADQETAGVECDDDLRGEVGASQRCTLTALDGTTYGVTATVRSVRGDDVGVDFVVDPEPMQ